MKWCRFRDLPAFEREFVVHAMVLLSLTEAGLRLVGFRRWKNLIEHFARPARRNLNLDAAAQLELAGRITRAARSAELHGLGTPNCLERSLTLWWLLRREGIDGELHIGARKTDSRFEAHAWVELAGVVMNDSLDIHKHYSRFDAPIAAAEAAAGTSAETSGETVPR